MVFYQVYRNTIKIYNVFSIFKCVATLLSCPNHKKNITYLHYLISNKVHKTTITIYNLFHIFQYVATMFLCTRLMIVFKINAITFLIILVSYLFYRILCSTNAQLTNLILLEHVGKQFPKTFFIEKFSNRLHRRQYCILCVLLFTSPEQFSL